MDESTKFNPCAICVGHCKQVFAILLIVVGLRLLASQLTGSRKNEEEINTRKREGNHPNSQ
jgi:hypothetical protein